MADLTDPCCTPAAQETCCEPSEKARCCGENEVAGCGCSAGVSSASATSIATVHEVRETVREKYAAAAEAAARGTNSGCCSPGDAAGLFGASLYGKTGEAAENALAASLGCGVPTAVADLHEAKSYSTLVLAPAPTC